MIIRGEIVLAAKLDKNKNVLNRYQKTRMNENDERPLI